MCLPLMDKLFRGGHRRRNNLTASPRPSLAPTPQQSSATIQTGIIPNTNTFVVATIKNETSLPAGKNTINAVEPLSVNTLENTASANRAGVSEVSQVEGSGAAIAGPSRLTSWWDYLGINKNKKGSIGSL